MGSDDRSDERNGEKTSETIGNFEATTNIEVTDEAVERFLVHVIPLKTSDPKTSTPLPPFIQNYFGDTRVIGLGVATHESRSGI